MRENITFAFLSLAYFMEPDNLLFYLFLQVTLFHSSSWLTKITSNFAF